MKHFGKIQSEFMAKASSNGISVPERTLLSVYKFAKAPPKGKDKPGSFLALKGQDEVPNPNPRGKKPSVKIVSLSRADKGTPQRKLFDALYKAWKGTGSYSSVLKGKSKKTKETGKQKPKGTADEIKRLKSELAKARKETAKEKSVRQKLEAQRDKLTKAKESEEIEQITTEPAVEPKVEEPKVETKIEDLKTEPKEEIKVETEEPKTKPDEQAVEKLDEAMVEEEQGDKKFDAAQQKQTDILEQVGDRSNKRYQETVNRINQNEGELHRDATFLKNPPPPKSSSIEAMRQNADAINRSLKALDVRGADIVDTVNSPNVVSYKLKFDTDKNKAKGMRSLLSRGAKDVISSLIGKEENVTISEDRKAGTVDIHVPKGTSLKDRDTVFFKDLITDDTFVKASKNPAKLPVALGKDENNNAVSYDFSDTPHLLVSGATKSGKSVFMQGIINSIQMSKSPEDAKLVLIDVAKKGAEFGMYDGNEYLARPVAMTAKDAENSLRAVHDEVGRRNKFFRDISEKTGLNIKNIEQWNTFITQDPESMSDEDRIAYGKIPEDQRKKIPRIVTIVDEAADLLNKDINPNAQRISSMLDSLLAVARSAGAHVVLATQSPAKQTIPGKLQKNLGAKMTLRLQNQNDAENIGTPDATDLLMYGDGFFNDPVTGRNVRVQSGYVGEDESAEISQKTKGEPTYLKSKREEVAEERKQEDADQPVSTDMQDMDNFRSNMTKVRQRLDEARSKMDRILEESAQREKERKKKKENVEAIESEEDDRAKAITDTEKERQKRINQSEAEAEFPPEPEIPEVTEPEIPAEVKGPETSLPVSPEGDIIDDEDEVSKAIEEMTKPQPITEDLISKAPKQEKKKESLLERARKLLKGRKSSDQFSGFTSDIQSENVPEETESNDNSQGFFS